ncbi:MAG TPA: hypothetical protein VMH81_36040 [Bryobacteraceae bacterium]|nr:hypothetical protein [Bryobacteraceae bacterium]
MDNPTAVEWRRLLTILLAQRLELNAIESALKNAGVVTGEKLKEIRTQATNTAAAWSSQADDDVLRLLSIHSQPGATMLVPQSHEELRRRFEAE